MENLAIISHIREFNRFYTVLMGTINHHFLGTPYSVTESRILFELLTNDVVTATYLVETLQLDKSYLSRLIQSLEKKKILYKKPSSEDKRVSQLFLTDQGKALTTELITAVNQQIEELISPLTESQLLELINSMATIKTLLNPTLR